MLKKLEFALTLLERAVDAGGTVDDSQVLAAMAILGSQREGAQEALAIHVDALQESDPYLFAAFASSDV